MRKPKLKPVPRAYVWMIFDPETGLYYKRTPNARCGRWVRNPYGYGSDHVLMKVVDGIRTHHPQAQVVPYALATESITDVENYGL